MRMGSRSLSIRVEFLSFESTCDWEKWISRAHIPPQKRTALNWVHESRAVFTIQVQLSNSPAESGSEETAKAETKTKDSKTNPEQDLHASSRNH